MTKYNEYFGKTNFQHDTEAAVGVLLTNVGSPEAPTAKALKPYLKQFLSDPRVIELPKLLWWLILNLAVLTTRPKKSAELYKKIWTKDGSPLLVVANSQRKFLEKELRAVIGENIHVAIGMGVGNPSIDSALKELSDKNCSRILLIPLFPQYSGTSTGSSFDAVVKSLIKFRWVPEIRTIMTYHDDSRYIAALVESIREHWAEKGKPEKLILSFHGIPKRYFAGGDPYYCFCQKTGRLVIEELGLSEEEYEITFQSLFGKEEWLTPATDKTLEALGKGGVRSVQVICPGFSVDCLETLEEIEGENKEVFIKAGGKEFSYIPCLNDRPSFIKALTQLCLNNLGGWVTPKSEYDAESSKHQACEAARRRAGMTQ